MKYKVEHEKRNSISTRSHVLFCLLYKDANDDSFDKFPMISEPLSKISKDSPKVVRRQYKRFRTFSENFRRLTKIAEDSRGRTDDISIIERYIEVLFNGICNYSNDGPSSSENNMLYSRVKIC